MVGISKFRIACVFIEPETVELYSLVLVDIAKNTQTNEILEVVIGKKNIRKRLTLKEIKQTLPKTRYTHLTSSIQGLSSDAVYFPILFDGKKSSSLVTTYMSNYSKISYGMGTPQNIEVGDGLYMHQTEGGASSYVIDISQIKVETIAVMASLEMVVKNRVQAMLDAYKED
jgi:hypothetical protein